MRKALILTVAMLFALAGFAAADASLDGLSVKSEIFVEGVSLDLADDDSVQGEYINARGRFWLTYSKADWKGVLALEAGEFTAAASAFGATTARDGKIVEVKNMYAQGPLGPATFTAGIQPIALGYSTIMDEDYPALTASIPAGPGALILAYVKLAETLYDDNDITGIAACYAGNFGGISLKPYGIYALTDDDTDDFYFVGLPFGGKFGAVDVKAEFDYVGGGDADWSDFSVWAKAMFGLGAANVYVEGGYGTEEMQQLNENFTYDIVWEDRARGKNGIRNLMFGKLGANTTMGDLMLDGAVIYDSMVEPSDQIGIEIDLKAVYKASASTAIEVGGGYLLAGDVFNDDQYKAYWKATYKY